MAQHYTVTPSLNVYRCRVVYRVGFNTDKYAGMVSAVIEHKMPTIALIRCTAIRLSDGEYVHQSTDEKLLDCMTDMHLVLANEIPEILSNLK